MRKKNPLVSIIVPAYNNGRYIGFCIESLINQTYKNIEIIIVDDASTDDTASVVCNYMKQDKRIQKFNGKHQGANIARGLGVKKATGDYYMFVDSDDWIKNDAVEKLVKATQKDNYDVVRFNGIMKPSNKLKNPYIDEKTKEKIVNGDEARRILATTPKLNNLCFQFYRAELLKGIKSFKEELSNAEDLFTNLEIYNNVKKVLFIGDVLYYYRSNDQSTTKNSDSRRLTKSLGHQIYVYANMLSRIAKWGFSEEEQEKTALMALNSIRGTVFALSKSDNMAKTKFVQILENELKNKDFKTICKKIDDAKARDFLKNKPLAYKIKCGRSVEYLYQGKITSVWRTTSLIRLASRVKKMVKLPLKVRQK